MKPWFRGPCDSKRRSGAFSVFIEQMERGGPHRTTSARPRSKLSSWNLAWAANGTNKTQQVKDANGARYANETRPAASPCPGIWDPDMIGQTGSSNLLWPRPLKSKFASQQNGPGQRLLS